MTLREELYNIARQVRAEEETAKSNAHKIFAEIYLKQQCRIAVAKGHYAVVIDKKTTLKNGETLTEKDVENFASENDLGFDPDIWELCFNNK